jgi:tRNA (adenine37-N6)-methyltransferase
MKSIQYRPIGIIHSPFKTREEVSVQPRLSRRVKGTIELQPNYKDGLSYLQKFFHIILVYHFHLSKDFILTVKTFHSDSSHGLFTTRLPDRPNPIGLSVVHLESIEKNTLYVSNIDIADGTPLLDIKPFISTLARQYGTTLGWLTDIYSDK